jgi:hypothetical protein
MKSCIKFYGPPILKAIKALEKIAIDMPEVCILDALIQPSIYSTGLLHTSDVDWTMRYFGELGEISYERCGKIISKSGERLGDYDFCFEWFKEPDTEQLHKLIEKIDEVITPLGCRYAITTK